MLKILASQSKILRCGLYRFHVENVKLPCYVLPCTLMHAYIGTLFAISKIWHNNLHII